MDKKVTAGSAEMLIYLERIGAAKKAELIPIVHDVCEYGSSRNLYLAGCILRTWHSRGNKIYAYMRENPTAKPDTVLAVMLYYAGFRTAKQAAFETGRDPADKKAVAEIADDLETLILAKDAVAIRHNDQRYCASWRSDIPIEDLPAPVSVTSPLSWMGYFLHSLITVHRRLFKPKPPVVKPADEPDKEWWQKPGNSELR
jgi:hypothetical protein